MSPVVLHMENLSVFGLTVCSLQLQFEKPEAAKTFSCSGKFWFVCLFVCLLKECNAIFFSCTVKTSVVQ